MLICRFNYILYIINDPSFLSTFINSLFSHSYLEHIFLSIQFWDMPGRRDQRSCIIPNYRGSHCCVLVYDVTSQESFESLEYWRQEFLTEIALPDGQRFPFVVIGNKIDLNDRMVIIIILKRLKGKKIFSGGYCLMDVTFNIIGFVKPNPDCILCLIGPVD